MGSAAQRERVQGMWAAVAPAWQAYADDVDARGAALAERMCDLARLEPGDRVLELACGPGGLGLEAARRVGAQGEVTLSDAAEGMVGAAGARAATLGLANVRARRLDFEDVAEPDAGFAAVLCREGLMFAVEPARAAGEVARVLRPGGRAVVSVWGPREANPWLGALLDAVGAELGRPLPPPGAPGPFALAGPGRLADLLRGAGLTDVAVEEEAVPLRAPSPEAWWERGVRLAGPVAGHLAALGPERVAAARRRALDAVARFRRDGALEIPGLALVASGRR